MSIQHNAMPSVVELATGRSPQLLLGTKEEILVSLRTE
jgi:hypothetical protein